MVKTYLKSILRNQLWRGARRRVAAEKPYVIAITGSVGKTTTKDAIADVLSKGTRPVFKTPGNLGSDMGVPLALLGFTEQPERASDWAKALWLSFLPPKPLTTTPPYYVLEYSSDGPGDIAFLCDQIKPHVGVLTTITPVHMTNYASMDALIAEKATLVRKVNHEGYVVLNADDPNQEELTEIPQAITYSLKGLEKTLTQTPKGMRLTWEGHTIATKVLGRPQVQSLLAAATVGKQEGIPMEKIIQALEAYEAPAGRGRLIQGRDDITIIDESYNASPKAMLTALQTLQEVGDTRRTVAILGAMNELGSISDEAHQQLGQEVAGYAQRFIAFGRYAELMAKGARAAGMAGEHVFSFTNRSELIDALQDILHPKDVVLVKGSQNGIYLERVVKALMAHPEQADELLVRQTPYWYSFS